MRRSLVIATSLVVLGMAGSALAQEARGGGRGGPARRPGLFFKEE